MIQMLITPVTFFIVFSYLVLPRIIAQIKKKEL